MRWATKNNDLAEGKGRLRLWLHNTMDNVTEKGICVGSV